MKSRLVCSITCLTCIISFSGCGAPIDVPMIAHQQPDAMDPECRVFEFETVAPTRVVTETNDVTTETTENNDITDENNSETDVKTEEISNKDTDKATTPSISAEEAQKIANECLGYVMSNDALGILKTSTYKEYIVTASDEVSESTTDEEIAKLLSGSWEKDKTYGDMRGSFPFFLYSTANSEYNYFDYRCENPLPMTETEVKNINAVVEYMFNMFADSEDRPEGSIDPQKIIDGYSFDIVYNVDGVESPDYKAYVVKTTAGDDYKYDLFYSPYAHASLGFVALSELAKDKEENTEHTKNIETTESVNSNRHSFSDETE